MNDKEFDKYMNDGFRNLFIVIAVAMVALYLIN